MCFLKNCFFKCLVVYAFVFMCGHAYASPTGGGGGGEIGQGGSPECSGQSTEPLADGYYCEGQVKRACPAGHACVNGVIGSRCADGQCAANMMGVCVESAGVQCVPCSGNTPYSNSSRTNCVSCSGAGVYVSGSSCMDCPDAPYNNNFYEPTIVEDKTGIASCGLKLKSTITGDCDGKVSNVNWMYESRDGSHTWKLSNMVVNIEDFDYVAIPENAEADLACGACENGKINKNHELGIDACVACPAGYCSGATGQCQLCESGHYCPLNDSGEIYSCSVISSDYKCPKGSFSATGVARCSRCASGYTTNALGTAYDSTTDDLSDICKKANVRLGFVEGAYSFPDNKFRQGKINANVVQSEQ